MGIGFPSRVTEHHGARDGGRQVEAVGIGFDLAMDALVAILAVGKDRGFLRQGAGGAEDFAGVGDGLDGRSRDRGVVGAGGAAERCHQ